MLWQSIWQQKKLVIYTIIAGTISGLTAVALFAQSGLLISKAALMPPFYTILILAAFLKLFGVAKSTSKYAERLLSHRVTFALMSTIRENYFATLLTQTALFQRYHSGDLLHRITSDVETLQHYFLRVVYPPLVAAVVFLATILFTVIFSWHIALLLMLGYSMTALVIPYTFAKLIKQPSILLKEQLSNYTTEYVYGYESLQLYNELASKEQQLLALSKAYSQQQERLAVQTQLAHLANHFVALAIAFIVLFIGASAVTTGNLQGVYLAMLLMITLTVFELATPLAAMPSYLAATQQATARLQQLTAQPIGDTVVNTLLPIEFRDITFQYDQALSPALHNVSLRIEQGEKIAIVGASGSGKTTLLQLLMKELTPQQGDILVNDTPIHTITDDSLFAQMSVQLQSNHFFTGTLRQNLQLAKPHARDEEMLDVLRYVQLPHSLDDHVQEKAANFSGGERQRLAYARVLLSNASCYVLDEPFANIDIQLKQQFLQELCGRPNTVLMISHDVQLLQSFDRIIVIDNGHIVEQGAPMQLIAKQGVFAQLLQK